MDTSNYSLYYGVIGKDSRILEVDMRLAKLDLLGCLSRYIVLNAESLHNFYA